MDGSQALGNNLEGMIVQRLEKELLAQTMTFEVFMKLNWVGLTRRSAKAIISLSELLLILFGP